MSRPLQCHARTAALSGAGGLAVMALVIGGALLLPENAESADATSAQFRLVGSAPASTSAIATSPAHRVYLVGGSGQPVGISASPNASVVTGGTSNQLPTERIFRDGIES